jgi:hypothetical protein
MSDPCVVKVHCVAMLPGRHTEITCDKIGDMGEALLERATSEHGLPTYSHRAATLVGASAPEEDIMSVVLRYSALLKGRKRVRDDQSGRL